MRYLFGDSTESRLEINYLAFLRDAIDFGVAVLSADAGLSQARDRRAQRERAAEDAAREVEAFGRAALQVAEPLSHGEAPVNRAAAAVARAITDAVQRELGRVRSGQGGELEQIVAELQRLRERCVSALGALLTTHDLPGAEETVTVQWGGAGAGYEARLIQHAELGLEATLALEIPAGSLFAGELRVDRLAEGVEVHAPETAGWLKKEVKRVPHKLGRHHVTLASVAGGGVVMRLRASLEAGAAGFDVTVARNGDVAVERAGKGEADGGFPTDERDLTGLRGLAAKLEAAVDGLRATRTGLVQAILDGKPLASHEEPAVLVERLVTVMAPVVHEIAAHSLSPRELVLKRLLGGDRREEIFLSRAELAGKLEALPAAQREVFAPLGLLDDMAGTGAGTGVGGAAATPVPARRGRATAPPPVADELAPAAGVISPGRAPAPPPVVEPAVEVAGAVEVAAGPPLRLDTDADTAVSEPEIVIEALAPGTSGVIEEAAAAASSPPEPEPAAASASEPEPPAITLEAELPPRRVRPASLPTLPPLADTPPRSKGKTVPPPPPPARMSSAATEAAVDAALRDLDDAEPTQVAGGPPRRG